MSAKNEHGLTAPQEKFAQCVATGSTQAEAYREAYPSSRTWKPESVHQKASTMAADVKVSARVKALQLAAADRAELVGAEILREVRRIAQSDIAGIINERGQVKLPHELDPATRAAVASFEIDEFGRIKYKFWDKNAALDKAMKHLGLFEKDNGQKAPLVPTRIELVPLTPNKAAEPVPQDSDEQ